ncbi:MAG TPA: glycosyl hydrolase [Propionibacteriaceae bacterium]
MAPHVLLSLLLVLVAGCSPPAAEPPVPPAHGQRAELGVYAGPGAKGVRAAGGFEGLAGAPVSRLLDFLPDDSWRAMTHADWLIKAHQRSGRKLELSIPMLPRRGGADLATCAAGDYNDRWRTIARRLRAARLQTATIRPGWEFNGDWYLWSAAGPGQAASYAGCFRQLVDSMRSVSGEHRFSWTVNLGHNRLPAELGWPGEAHVDVVGVDVYDYSTQWYPAPEGVSKKEARRRVWDAQLNGDHGLRYWAQFARDRNKPLAIPEWGLAWRSDGHAGGDNTYFLEQLGRFINDPENGVAYATYFNSEDTPDLKHNLLGPDTKFPQAARRFSALIASR